MSALYIMRYVAQPDAGFGTVYIGRGVFLGTDVANGRYGGTYAEAGGRIRGEGKLYAPPGGAKLANGIQLAPGQFIPVRIDWPEAFADGEPQSISVMGHQVQVTFEKVGDVP